MLFMKINLDISSKIVILIIRVTESESKMIIKYLLL